MPTTVNGIGTTYVGKKNLSKRNVVCPHCGKASVLSSYDTRLCVVVLFIPIVPLGKKRVLDQCGRCSRHHVMALEDYHQARDRTLEDLGQASVANPGDAEAAVAYNSALFDFHQAERGLAHLDEIAARFAGDVDVQLYAGAVHEREGRGEEATRFFDRAFEIDPRNPGARRARAMTLIETGRLHDARSLLDTTDADHRDPTVVFLLAQAYHREPDPHTALAIYRQLLAEHPALARRKEVRKAVSAAERDARVGASILPPRVLPWKTVSTVAMVVAVVLTVVWGYDAYLRRHHPLFVVNGYPGKVEVRLDGEPMVFPGQSRRELKLSEGAHRAEILSPWREDVDFELRRAWGDRVSGGPTAVLNLGGLAVLIVEEVVYSDRHVEVEPVYRPFGGQSFRQFKDVDYPFVDSPDEITLPSGKHQVRKTALVEMTASPEESYWMFLEPRHAQQGLDYLERWIALEPRDSLLDPYAAVAAVAEDRDRAAEFLAARLSADPVNVEWHRTYQELSGRESEALTARYDALLAADPENPDLLYLRGRVDPAGGSTYVTRALAIDPKHRYSRLARAFDAMTRADFASAVVHYAELVAEGHFDLDVEGPYLQALFATGQWSTLEPMLRVGLEDPESLDWSLAGLLIQALVRQGRTEEAGELVREVGELERTALEGEVLMSPWLKAQLFYATGRWEDLRRTVSGADFPPHWKDEATLWWITESGDFDSLPKAARLPYNQLVLSLACLRHGQPEVAATRLREALPKLAALDPMYRRFAGMIRGEIPVTRETIGMLRGQSEIKAVVLTALAAHQSEERAFLLREARKHDFQLGFPHHLLASFQP